MKEIRMVVKGRELVTSAKPEYVEGKLLVPLQETAHALGILGRWDGASFVLQGKQQISVFPQQAFYLAGGARRNLPLPTKVNEGKLLVPVRLLTDNFELKVLWDRLSGAVLFMQPEKILAGAKIVLDPGHGGKDLGGCGELISEKDFALALGRHLGQLLSAAGANVVYTRRRDHYFSSAKRARLTNAQEPELFVSIHGNYFHDLAAGGIETYYYRSWPGQKLAAFLQRELCLELNLEDRGAREASFQLLRTIKAPAALVKMLYLSNPAEERLAADGWFRQRAILALYRGIKTFLAGERQFCSSVN